MKSKILLTIGIILVLMSNATLFAGTDVDDFNRATLGGNWTADPEYVIVGNSELSNSSTTADWTSLAVYNAVSNPIEVSFRWSLSGDTEGANSGGIAARLSSASVTASGYHIMRRYTKVILSPIVNGVIQRDNSIQEVNPTQSTPQPGDVIKIIISSDAGGHHFDFYINGLFDARITDANKTYGNGTTWYSGVGLFGNRDNNIDDFTVRYPSITVTSPNGSEDWTENTAHTIQWTSDSFTGNVRIEYSTNGGVSWNTIIASTSNNGSYPWTVPNTPSFSCLVKISDSVDGEPCDMSNAYFTISPEQESITVNAPNGGENWIIGTNNTITWYSSGGIANVKIEYSIDGGTNWTTEIASTPNTGSYVWSAPNNPSTECKVKVSDASDFLPADESDATFTLSALVQLRVNGGSGEPGSPGNSVFINMNNQVIVKGLQFTLTDTPDLITATNVNTTTRSSGFSATFSETAGVVKLMLISLTGAQIVIGNGPILEFIYTVDPLAPDGGSTTMSLSNVSVADASNQNVFAEVVDGEFHFATPGDVDSDGDVDPADIARLVQIVLGDNPTSYELLVADFDQDGEIDIYDLLRAYDLQS